MQKCVRMTALVFVAGGGASGQMEVMRFGLPGMKWRYKSRGSCLLRRVVFFLCVRYDKAASPIFITSVYFWSFYNKFLYFWSCYNKRIPLPLSLQGPTFVLVITRAYLCPCHKVSTIVLVITRSYNLLSSYQFPHHIVSHHPTFPTASFFFQK